MDVLSKDQIKEMDYKISVMQAYRNGKKIMKKNYFDDNWIETWNIIWDWDQYVYKIKDGEDDKMEEKENVCEHNYNNASTKSKLFAGMQWNEGACYTKRPVYNEIETLYLYCTKCGKILKVED